MARGFSTSLAISVMKADLVIGTNASSSIRLETCQCIESTRWDFRSLGIEMLWLLFPDDGRAKCRSIIASKFLRNTTASCLIIVDRDLVFAVKHATKLYDNVIAGYDFVSGLFGLRNSTTLSITPFENPFPIDGTIREVEFMTTGFTGYSRKLLEKIRDDNKMELLYPESEDAFYPFFEEKFYPKTQYRDIPSFLGEDWDFCEKARKSGFKAYVDTSIQVGHLGEKLILVKDVLDYKKADWREPAYASV